MKANRLKKNPVLYILLVAWIITLIPAYAGAAMVANGSGQYSWSNGDSYQGMFQNARMHGQGVYVWANGDRYMGEFNGNRRSGQGSYVWKTGERYSGAFRDDKLTGRGDMTWANGDVYTGNFENGLMSGAGVYTWKNGNTYSGAFVGGKRVGRGTYKWSDGSKYEGHFRENKLQGFGVMTWKNGDQFTGYFADGKIQGYGTYTRSGLTPKTGRWNAGRLETATKATFTADAGIGMTAFSYSWQYQGTAYRLGPLNLENATHDPYVKSLGKFAHPRFYKMALQEPAVSVDQLTYEAGDAYFLDPLAFSLEQLAWNAGLSDRQTAEFVAAFAGGLPNVERDIKTGFNDYTRYPVETLVKGGDSEDTSILTAALLQRMGYETAMLYLPVNAPEHAAVGVWGDLTVGGTSAYTGGKRYYYLETIGGDGTLGVVPTVWRGNYMQVYPLKVISSSRMLSGQSE